MTARLTSTTINQSTNQPIITQLIIAGSLDDDEEDDDDNNINNDIDKYTDNDDATIDESESSISWQERLLCVLRDGRIVAVTPDMVVAVMREGQPELGGATAAVAE